MGLDDEVAIMHDTGFQILDSIISQRSLIDVTHGLQCIQYGTVPPQFLLCAPLLLCGERSEALFHLSYLYANCWMAFHSRYDHLKEEGQGDAYLSKEEEWEKESENITRVLELAMGRRDCDVEGLRKHFMSNLQRNIALAQQAAIPFSDNFCVEGLSF